MKKVQIDPDKHPTIGHRGVTYKAGDIVIVDNRTAKELCLGRRARIIGDADPKPSVAVSPHKPAANWTRDELVEWAAAHKVTHAENATKAEILSAIRDAE